MALHLVIPGPARSLGGGPTADGMVATPYLQNGNLGNELITEVTSDEKQPL